MSVSTITVRMCESVQRWIVAVPSSAADGLYTVQYHHEGNPLWVCSCPHHQYRHVECKHIKAAKTLRCAHGINGLSGSPVEIKGNKCPKCNGPLITVEVAV